MCERSRSPFGKRFLLRKYSFLIQTNDWRAGTHSVYVCGIIPFSNIAVQSSCVRWFPFRYGNGAADIDPAQDCCLGQHQNGCVDVTPNRPAAHGMMRSEAPRTMSNETNIDFYISAAMSCTKADVFCRVIIFVAAYQLIYDLDVCFISHFFSITIFKYKESQKSIYLTQLILVC